MAEKKEKKESRKNKNKKYRTKEFSFVTYFFLILFLAMMGYYSFFLTFKSESFINSPYNGLQDLFSEHVVRGDITTADGHVIATTDKDDEGNEVRVYPYKNMFAHVVGYSVNGKSGLENQMNFSLLRSHSFFIDRIVNDIMDVKNDGDTVITTLNFDLQEAAYNALGDHDGAVIVMEPSTGKILAMVSKPDYNPENVEENWEEINSEESTVLYNRATQGQYAPGSTFKIFTTLEFYREKPQDFLAYTFYCDSEYTHSGFTIHCAGLNSHESEDIYDSFANSCNSSYANIAANYIDADKFNETLNEMLFNMDLPISFESNKSTVSISSSDDMSMIMSTAIGQGKTYVSPLHMVMIASAIDNNGIVMKPYLVDEVTSKSGVNVRSYSPKSYDTIFTTDECQMLEECMSGVTSRGTAAFFAESDYHAYGKTGTAQVSDSTDKTNSWFVGYAKLDGYEDIAIAVVVEDYNEHGLSGSRVAKKVFDAYFN